MANHFGEENSRTRILMIFCCEDDFLKFKTTVNLCLLQKKCLYYSVRLFYLTTISSRFLFNHIGGIHAGDTLINYISNVACCHYFRNNLNARHFIFFNLHLECVEHFYIYHMPAADVEKRFAVLCF